MQYFTAQEAKRIIDNSAIGLCTRDECNPNREAFSAALDIAQRGHGTVWSVMTGFHLGVALGKRMERARRAGKAVRA